MKISLIPNDGFAIIDGESRAINFAGIDPTIHAVQFDTIDGFGTVEIAQRDKNGVKFSDNVPLKSIAAFQVFIDRWTAAAPPAPTTPPPDTVTPALKAALITAQADATVPASLKAVLTALQNKLTP